MVKKNLITVVGVLVLVVGILSSSWATVLQGAIPTTVNSTTYTKITNTGPSCSGFLIWVTDCTGFYYARNAAGAGETYVDPDVTCALGFPQYVPAGEDVVWIKSVSASTTVYFQAGK